MQSTTTKTQIEHARKLWFSSYHGVLSTHSLALPGYPFGSLAPLCRDRQGLPILLLSHLAQHTQNLQENGLCSLILLGQGEGDVQELERLTCLGRITQLSTAPVERYFRYFPDSRNYHEQLNFHFYKLEPERFYFIGGFGSARWFEADRILPYPTLSDHAEAKLLNMSRNILTEHDYDHQPVGIDELGLDIRAAGQISRIMFSESVNSPEAFIHSLQSHLQNQR